MMGPFGYLCWSLTLFISIVAASALAPVPRAAAFSVDDALSVLLKADLFDLCAAYIHKPPYGATTTMVVTTTVEQTKTVKPSTSTIVTVTSGKITSTISEKATVTTSTPFGTDTVYSFFVVTKSSTTTTTLPVTTIYTTKSRNAPHKARAAQNFPPPLASYTSILSRACSSLLAYHTYTKTSTKVTGTTLTNTAPTSTSTVHIIVPSTTVRTTTTRKATTTEPYLAYTTTTTTFTNTEVITSTVYASTTRVPAQCAPSAYVASAHQYTDEGINFANPTTQPDDVTCCSLCDATPNCQAWIFYTDPPFFQPPGTCSLVVGTNLGTCPASNFNAGFVPICSGGVGYKFDIGLGACQSDISLTAQGCALGPNQ